MNKKILVVLVVVCTVAQAGFAGVAYFGRRAADRELEAERARAAATQHQLYHARESKAEMPPAPPSRWQLLSGADVSGTLQVIQSLGDAAGIEFGSVKAAPSSTAGRQSFQITGRGTPDQVCLFCADIEQNGRLIVVESGKFLPGSAEEIAFEFGLATYHSGGGQ